VNGLGPNDPIPDRLYFKIGEVAALVGVEPHVLRYWEKEIPSIRPAKSSSRQRRYRYKDVQTFRTLRALLHDERYTLEGARKKLQDTGEPAPLAPTPAVDLTKIRRGLQDLVRLAGE
jgi:DNA-binding transcriptional MerR regulator